jgi:hypothetical protein
MTPTEAFLQVSRYVDEVPLTENIGVASDILMHALVGEATDPVGKPATGKATRRKKATA